MMMNLLKKFMVGRYGADQLSIFLLIVSMIITLISRITGSSILMTISYIPLILTGYRMLSKDLKKRSMENYKFAILVSPIYSKFKKVQYRVKDFKTHKYYTCTKCKTTLRVPRGKGKILITCTRCKDKFTRET